MHYCANYKLCKNQPTKYLQLGTKKNVHFVTISGAFQRDLQNKLGFCPGQDSARNISFFKKLWLGQTSTPPTCFGGRTIMFLVKFESSVLCTPEAYIGHLGYFVPHLMNKKGNYGSNVLKKCTSKIEIIRKCFLHVFVYQSN